MLLLIYLFILIGLPLFLLRSLKQTAVGIYEAWLRIRCRMCGAKPFSWRAAFCSKCGYPLGLTPRRLAQLRMR